MNNKFLSIAASTAIVASALVFTGCGDSDSSSAADTTPTASTASGTWTATALKGAWSGLNYTVTANGTGKNTNASMTNGKVLFNKGDNVTVDLGAALWKLSGIASNNTVASFAQAGSDGTGTLLRPNGTAYTAAETANVKDNLFAVVAMMNNNSAAVETTGFNAASIIANLRTLSSQGLDLTTAAGSAQFVNALVANFSTTAMSGKNMTDAVSAVNTYGLALKNAALATYGETVAAAAGSTANALNSTMLNGTFVYLKNGTGTYVFDTASGATNLTTGTTLESINSWNASGSTIKLNGVNTSNLTSEYMVFGGVIDTSGATATPVTYVDNKGVAYTYTLSGVKANLSNLVGTTAYPLTGSNKNITFTSSGATVLDIRLMGGNNINASTTNASIKYANGTYVNSTGSSYKVLKDSYELPTILALYSDNGNSAISPTNSFLNVTFDFNPTNQTAYTNGGVIATIVNSVVSWIASMKTFFLGLFQ